MSLSEAPQISRYSRPWLHKGSGHWCMHIGYKMMLDHKRIRAFHTFGTDENEAISMAVAKQNEWRLTVDNWFQRKVILDEMIPGYDWRQS